MIVCEYDAIITNIADTEFTAYYKKGKNVKLSDRTTVVTVYKPGQCKGYNGECYKDAMFELSGNGTNRFHYQDLIKMYKAIESAIDILNKENENLIDRSKECNYDQEKQRPQEKKETKAMKYKDLEIGGIYKDNKNKEWIFLGEADLYQNNRKENRSNGYKDAEFRYIYMPNIEGLEKTDENWFKSPNSLTCTIDSYASKKRFFEKIGQLEVLPNQSITFYDNYSFYAVYGKDVVDQQSNEEKIKQLLLGKKEKKRLEKENCHQKAVETVVKIMSAVDPITININFSEKYILTCQILGEKEEFTVSGVEIYESFFAPLITGIIERENSENIQYKMIDRKDQEGVKDYLLSTTDVNLSITNMEINSAETIERYIESSITQTRNQTELKGKGVI